LLLLLLLLLRVLSALTGRDAGPIILVVWGTRRLAIASLRLARAVVEELAIASLRLARAVVEELELVVMRE
jgi:hypothetical protein